MPITDLDNPIGSNTLTEYQHDYLYPNKTNISLY